MLETSQFLAESEKIMSEVRKISKIYTHISKSEILEKFRNEQLPTNTNFPFN